MTTPRWVHGMAAVIAVAMIGVPVLLPAQAATTAAAKANAKSRAPACAALDTTASWYRRQRAWLDERQTTWSDTAMRATLLRVVASSPEQAGSSALLGYELTDALAAGPGADETALIAQLKALAAQRGSTWPTRSVVGPRGVLVVWSLAGRDTTLARVALKRMMEAGPDESPPAAVAILEDRQRVRVGRKQLYGTQLHRGADGVLVPLPIEDEAHLALRRDGAELPPLAQSLCAARRGTK